MNYADNIIDIVQSIVDQMTPTITIDDNQASGTNWKLDTCTTYWIHKGMVVTIGGQPFTVEDFVLNESITVKGAAQPVGASFQLSAPEFWHGSHRKVDSERNETKNVRNPFVYLPVPVVRQDGAHDTDIAYRADIRPLFLLNYNERRDTIELQQTEVIDPANEMADLFYFICEQDDRFEDPLNLSRREWMNFGDETVWGNEELIFDQPLSGVEMKFTLEVFIDSYCECPDKDAPVLCPDVTTSFQGVATGVDTAAGQNIEFTVVDDGNNPVGTLIVNTANAKKVEVTGTGDPVTIEINGTFWKLVAAGGTEDIPVVNDDEDPVGSIDGTLFKIGNSTININSVLMQSLVAEGTANIRVWDGSGNEIGVKEDAITWRVAGATTFFLNLTGQETSDLAGDDGDQFLSGTYANEILTDIYTLKNVNEWGHLKRLTGDTGGYMNEVTGAFFDKDGVGTTKALAFPNDIIRDYAFRRRWHFSRSGSRSWTDCINNTPTETVGGETGWRVPSRGEYETMSINNDKQPTYIDSRLFTWSAFNMWSSTRVLLTPASAQRYTSGTDTWSPQAKTVLAANAYIKNF